MSKIYISIPLNEENYLQVIHLIAKTRKFMHFRLFKGFTQQILLIINLLILLIALELDLSLIHI